MTQPVPFTWENSQAYFDLQDVAPDHRYALMRHSPGVDLQADYDRVTRPTAKPRGRIDRKRQKRSHR